MTLTDERLRQIEEWANRDAYRYSHGALYIRDLLAERREMLTVTLKAFTIVEYTVGEGRVLQYPFFDADDTLLEMVEVLGVQESFDARRELELLPEPPHG